LLEVENLQIGDGGIAAVDLMALGEREVRSLRGKEIGLILGVVESRISQIHASAVLHLRARLADFAERQEPAASARRPPKNAC